MDNGGKIWKITGYTGFSEYDGPEDDNLIHYMVFDKRFGKKTVEDLLSYYFSKKYPYVVINATDKITE